MRALVVLLVLSAVAHADTTPRTALVIVVDRTMTPEKLDVVNSGLRDALRKMPDGMRVAIVSAGRKLHVVAPFQEPKRIGRRAEIAGDLDADVVAALGRAFQILNIKVTAQFTTARAIVISDRDALLGVSSYAKKMADAGFEVSTYGLGWSAANKRAIDAIATSGGGMAYHQRDGVSLAEALGEEARRVGPPPNEHAYIVLLDRTAAMMGPRLERAKEAVRIGIEVMQPNDFVAVIEFGEVATVYVRPQRAANKSRLSNDIARLGAITETTTGNLGGALELANEVIDRLPPSRKHVVVVASGAWPREGVADAVNRLRARSVDVHCIAVDPRLRKFLDGVAPTIDADDPTVSKLFARTPVEE